YSGTMRDVPITVSPTSPAGSEFLGNVESGPLNPNGEINAHEHGWESSTKVSGVYQFPFQILVSGNLEERSGYFWARSVRFTGGRTIPNITVNVEPIGGRPLPDSTQCDLRVGKAFRSEINAHEHGWESSTKVSGVYQFPFQILVSGNLEERSGYFWARSVRFTGGRTIPNITVNVEPIGARQLPDSTQLDLRVEKTF